MAETRNTDQLELIQAMRFPLMMMVLFEHSVRTYTAPMRWSLDSANIYHFLTEMFSHYFCSMAVCWFFFFSGFLFYYNLGDGQFGKEWAVKKWKRRIHSILIPYLLWNLFNVVMVLLVTFVFKRIGITISSDQMYAVNKGPLFWFVTGPIDFPLWYLRDLIILSLLAPALYYPVRKYPWITLGVLIALYLLSGWKSMFLMPGLFFFGVGAWTGIRRDDLIAVFRPVRYPATLLAVVLLLAATATYQQPCNQFLRLLFLPFGMIMFLNICNVLLSIPRHRKNMLRLTETVFFIYAAHEIYILGWTKGFFDRVLGEYLYSRWIAYLFVPVVTLAVCLVLFYLLKRIAPRFLSFICGWRTVHRVHDANIITRP